jgi:hypothetical protein
VFLDPLDRISRRRYLDAQMATDAEQVAVSRHDELGATGHRCGDNVVRLASRAKASRYLSK